MKLGARMLKTGLAVAVALYTATILGFTSPVFAGIAAAFSIQPSIYRSYQSILEQIQANFIGAISAIIMVMILGNDPFVIGFTIVIVIGACMSFKMKETTVSLAVVAVIAIMETTNVPFIEFASIRFTTILTGILAAFFVNLIFIPPKYETKLFYKVDRTTSGIFQWLRMTTRHLSDHPTLKAEIQRLQDELTHMDQMYLLYKEERTYFKKRFFEKARKLVLFRQLITCTRKSFYLLRTLYQLDDHVDSLPPSFRTQFINELDKVIHAHEKLILMCMGRIKEEKHDPLANTEDPNIPELIEAIIDRFENNDNQEEKLKLLPLAAKLMDYHQQLQHLKRLLVSYQHYHKTEQLNTKHEED